MFSPSRLTLARKRRGLSKRELAQQLHIHERTIIAWESGEWEPAADALALLTKSLQFPASFFFASEILLIDPKNASFRASSKLAAYRRDATLAAGELALEFSKFVDLHLTLPPPAVPDLRGSNPELAAQSVRQLWGLGERPISNMIHLLESKGVRVFSLAEESKSVDAFSFWREDVPFVFLNTFKSPERSRFDAAHELAHLVLHAHAQPIGRQPEYEADKFAAALLMPSADVLATIRINPTLDTLVEKKRVWNVSLSALIYRCQELGLLSEWHCKQAWIELGRRFGRTSEPNGLAKRESSILLKKAFELLWKKGFTTERIAEQLHLDVTELDRLVFNLIEFPSSAATSPRTGQLRLVRKESDSSAESGISE